MLWLSGPGTGAYGAGAAIAMDGGMSNTACYYTQAVDRRGVGEGVTLPVMRTEPKDRPRWGLFLRLPKSSQVPAVYGTRMVRASP